MTDIRHIAGSENVVTDTLSRVEGIQKAIQREELAKAQETDKEFKNIMTDPQSLKMENTNSRDGNISVLRYKYSYPDHSLRKDSDGRHK